MAVSVTCTGVFFGAGGSIRVRFADGTELEFDNLADMQASISTLDTDPADAQMWAIAHWMRIDPMASNTGHIVGTTTTLDATAAQVVKVQ